LILPEPVTLKRFLAPECVFIFGIITYSFNRVQTLWFIKKRCENTKFTATKKTNGQKFEKQTV
jgi:hypothetical protein